MSADHNRVQWHQPILGHVPTTHKPPTLELSLLNWAANQTSIQFQKIQKQVIYYISALYKVSSRVHVYT